tara:strand:+ start:900 stop:1109 length:210 start_codon:yes stop_codon:yes gene_type:complete
VLPDDVVQHAVNPLTVEPFLTDSPLGSLAPCSHERGQHGPAEGVFNAIEQRGHGFPLEPTYGFVLGTLE